MEISPFQPYDIRLNPLRMLSYYRRVPENYVHWRETPQSHVYSADIPGVRKEEIKVEVEDSRYLIIRTEFIETDDPPRGFIRKFRLPGRIHIEGISAGYEDGVLTVTVPRMGFHIHPVDLADRLQITAKAA